MKNLIILLLVFFAINTANAQWVQKSSMFDYGRYQAVSFTINNKAYVGLGQIYDGSKTYDFWEYDPIANTWSRIADYPGQGSYGATAFAIKDKGYVCLGANNSNTGQKDLWEYSPSTNQWTQKASFPGIARYGASCFVIGDSAFVGTGSYGSGYDYLYDMWMYDSDKNVWTQKSDFPGFNRSHATAFTIGRYGYFGTGLQDYITATNDMWKYNVNSDTWIRIADIPGLPFTGAVSFVIGNSGYIGTGYDFIQDRNRFYKYNTTSNVWNIINSSGDVIKRRSAISFSINNIGYVGTGYTDEGLLTDLWAFDPNFVTEKTKNINQIDLKIYPNPTLDYLNIETTKINSILSIVDVSGQELYCQSMDENKTLININNLISGIYFIRLKDINSFEVGKFIKE